VAGTVLYNYQNFSRSTASVIPLKGVAGNRGIDRLRHRSFKFNPALLGISIRIHYGFKTQQ
jgi:hypothetical protein